MKRIVLFLTVSLLAMGLLFGQKASYDESLKKAKSFEKNNQFAYALGSYYDALISNKDNKQKSEALNGYKKLSENIKKGLPGNASGYSVFQLHNEWRNLLIDAEKYASEYGCYEIDAGNLEQGALDFNLGTATYEVELKICNSVRFESVVEVINEGYQVAYRDNKKNKWSDLPPAIGDGRDESECWPCRSVSVPNGSDFKPNGAALYGAAEYESSVFWNPEINSWDNTYTEISIQYWNAWAAYVQFNKMDEGWNRYYTTLYEVELSIADDATGKDLVPSQKVLLSYSNGRSDFKTTNVSFDKISEDVMNLIDSGKAHLKFHKVNLKYGKYVAENDKSIDSLFKNFSKSEIKNFPIVDGWKVKCNPEEISFTTAYYVQDCPKSAELVDDFKNFSLVYKNSESFAVSRIPVTIGLFKKYVGKPSTWDEDNFYLTDEGSSKLSIQNAYAPALISLEDAYEFCNSYSIANGLEPVYSFSLNKNDGYMYVQINPNANGYRFLTDAEADYIKREGILDSDFYYSGSDEFDEIGVSDRQIPVASKKSNRLGIYDFNSYDVNNYFQNEKKSFKVYNYNFIFKIYLAKNLSSEEVRKAEIESSKMIESVKGEFNELVDSYVSKIVSEKETEVEIDNKIYFIGLSKNSLDVYRGITIVKPFKKLGLNNKYYEYYFLNEASISKNFEPVYSYNGEYNPEKWSIEDFDEASVKEDFNKTGYRFSSANESRKLDARYRNCLIRYGKEETEKLEMERLAKRDNVIEQVAKDLRNANFTGSTINGIYTMVANNITVYSDLLNEHEPFKSFNNSSISIYYVLNKASIINGYKPAYSYKGETDPDLWPQRNLYRSDFEINKKAGYFIEGTSSAKATVYYYDKTIADKELAEINAKRDGVLDSLIRYIIKSNYKGMSHDGVYTMSADNVVFYSSELDTYEPFKTYNNKLLSSYYILNKASIKAGLEPVYSVYDEVDPDNWPVEKLSGLITVSKTASGFRREGKRGANSSTDTISYHDEEEQRKYDEKISADKIASEKKKTNILESMINTISKIEFEVYRDSMKKRDFLMSTTLLSSNTGLKDLLPTSFSSDSVIKYILNVVSVANGYEPVYSVNNDTNPENWNLARYRRVDESANANGYRLAAPGQLACAGYKNNTSTFAIVRYDDVKISSEKMKKVAAGKKFLDSIGLSIDVFKTQNVRLYYKGGAFTMTDAAEHKVFALTPAKKSKALKSGFKNDDLFIVHEGDTGKLPSTTKIILDTKVIDMSEYGLSTTVEDIYAAFATADNAKKVIIQVRRRSAGAYDLKEITVKK